MNQVLTFNSVCVLGLTGEIWVKFRQFVLIDKYFLMPITYLPGDSCLSVVTFGRIRVLSKFISANLLLPSTVELLCSLKVPRHHCTQCKVMRLF
jgi:hypothetical protein